MCRNPRWPYVLASLLAASGRAWAAPRGSGGPGGAGRSCDALHSAEGVQGAADTDRLCEALQARDPSAATPLAVPADRAGLAGVTPWLAAPCGQVAGVEAALAERVTGGRFGGHGGSLGSGSAGRVNGQDLAHGVGPVAACGWCAAA